MFFIMRKMPVKKLLSWFILLFLAWGAGWFSHQKWNTRHDIVTNDGLLIPQQPALLNGTDSSWVLDKDGMHQPDPLVVMNQFLEENDFQGTFEQFDILQEKASDTIVQQARSLIFSHARRLINTVDYRSARQLLNRYLLSDHRDVEARLLLAKIDLIEKDYLSAISALYEAKGYAYRAETIDQVRKQIRSVVDNQTKLLQQDNNSIAILELYQHLTQLEPDYAPYFLRLAAAQFVLKDTNGARRSLNLIVQDADVGSQAQALLDKVIHSEPLETEKSISVKAVDIPLLRMGDHFLVDALLNNSQQVRLLIDTGASMTILTPDFLQRSTISYLDTGKKMLFNTANGQVSVPMYKIESLSLGEWQVNQMEIGVMPLDNETAFNGLLGMNFLKHFQFYIDQNDAYLRIQELNIR